MSEGKFNAKPLAALGAIYRFVGGLGGVGRVDLNSPIVVVHDVSREAELGATLMVSNTHSLTTAGTGTLAFITVEIADFFSGDISIAVVQLRALGRNRANTDVYLMSLALGITAATAANTLAIRIGARPPNDASYVSTPGQTPVLLFRGGGELAGSEVQASGQLYSSTGQISSVGVTQTLPMRVETVFELAQDDGVGPCTVTFNEVLAFVPKGSPPPLAT